MTDEQEQMLQAVLRNQEVIMNALAELLTDDAAGRRQDVRRGPMMADLGTCVGFTHYYLAALASDSRSKGRGHNES